MATRTNGMTERELLQAIVDGTEITAEMQTKAQAMIDSLDKKNAKRKESGTAKQRENAEIKAKILDLMTAGQVYTAKELADTIELTTQRTSALCGQLVTAGKLEKTEVKTKSGKVLGYSLIVENADSATDSDSETE